MKRLLVRRLVPAGHMSLAAALLLAIDAVAWAGDPVAVATLTSLPAPNHNAFNTSFRYDSYGILFAWDGYQVWRQNGVNLDAFTSIGTVVAGNSEPLSWPGSTGGPYNSADAGPINFSGDGQQILLGNGSGGYGPWGGKDGIGPYEFEHTDRIWSMPISGGAVSLPSGTQPVGKIAYHNDFLPLPDASTITGKNQMYFVNQGNATYSGSSISVFDQATGTNVTVIDNGPGATTSLAFNPKNGRLYAGVGYGADRGKIYSFGLDQLDQAFKTNTPLDFVTNGTLFNPTAWNNQSGAGMFFDADGYLFSGGNEGITCFKPDGTLSKVLNMGDYTALVYNPANDQVLAIPYYPGTTGGVFNARDFEPVWSANPGSNDWAAGSNWSDNTSPGATAGATSEDAAVFNGAGTTLVVTPDAGRNVKNIAFDTASAGAYVIGTTGGNPLTLTSGGTIQTTSAVAASQNVNAPLLIANTAAGSSGTYAFTSGATAGTATLNFGGRISGAATSGNATVLTLNGANTGANTVSGVIGDGDGDGKLAVGKSGSGTWVLSATNTYTGFTTVAAGTLQLNGVSVATTLDKQAWYPVLDLGGADIQSGKMVFDYNAVGGISPATAIQGMLAFSYNGGLWNVGQFRNSTTGTTGLTLGWKDSGTQVTVMATYAGDANLDGEVDGADVDIWKLNVGTTGVDVWELADFNYDGEVDGADVDIWKLNVGSSLGGLLGLSVGGMSQSMNVVPEPGTLALLGAGLLGLLVYAWRRRK
jgi:autotransporter-associated beta strand protein